MFRLIWALSVRTRYFLRRYMPTNILLDAIRIRRGLRWGVPAMVLAIPYLYAASICAQLAENGGPGWLHLVGTSVHLERAQDGLDRADVGLRTPQSSDREATRKPQPAA